MNIVFGDYSLPFQKHSMTSHDAAVRAEPRAGTHRGIIFDRFCTVASYGATDEEMQTMTRLNPSTQRPRRIELVKQGWIKDSGRTRATRSGAQAVVWVLADPK
jgi:protein involved in temperature-dependent protein secretion